MHSLSKVVILIIFATLARTTSAMEQPNDIPLPDAATTKELLMRLVRLNPRHDTFGPFLPQDYLLEHCFAPSEDPHEGDTAIIVVCKNGTLSACHVCPNVAKKWLSLFFTACSLMSFFGSMAVYFFWQ